MTKIKLLTLVSVFSLLSGQSEGMKQFNNPFRQPSSGSGIRSSIISPQKNPPKRTRWSEVEDEIIKNWVERNGAENWSQLVAKLPGRTEEQCRNRWEKILNPDLVKGSWTKEEDQTIRIWVSRNGPKNWSKLAEQLPGRIGKQCKERWNTLDMPSDIEDIRSKPWTKEEDDLLISLHEQLGEQWYKIASHLKGRTDNNVKNRWHSKLKKEWEKQKYPKSPIIKSQNTGAILTAQQQLPILPDPNNGMGNPLPNGNFTNSSFSFLNPMMNFQDPFLFTQNWNPSLNPNTPQLQNPVPSSGGSVDPAVLEMLNAQFGYSQYPNTPQLQNPVPPSGDSSGPTILEMLNAQLENNYANKN